MESRVPQDIIQYHGAFSHYIAPPGGQPLPQDQTRTSASLRQLASFSDAHFGELSADMYEELQRRLKSTDGPLQPRNDIHWQRNDARKHVGSLPESRFREICRDLVTEQERRFPDLKTGPTYPLIDSMGFSSIRRKKRSQTRATERSSSSSSTARSSSVKSSSTSEKSGWKRNDLTVNTDLSEPSLQIQSVSESSVTPTKVKIFESESGDESDSISSSDEEPEITPKSAARPSVSSLGSYSSARAELDPRTEDSPTTKNGADSSGQGKSELSWIKRVPTGDVSASSEISSGDDTKRDDTKRDDTKRDDMRDDTKRGDDRQPSSPPSALSSSPQSAQSADSAPASVSTNAITTSLHSGISPTAPTSADKTYSVPAATDKAPTDKTYEALTTATDKPYTAPTDKAPTATDKAFTTAAPTVSTPTDKTYTPTDKTYAAPSVSKPTAPTATDKTSTAPADMVPAATDKAPTAATDKSYTAPGIPTYNIAESATAPVRASPNDTRSLAPSSLAPNALESVPPTSAAPDAAADAAAAAGPINELTAKLRSEAARYLEEMRELTKQHDEQVERARKADAEATRWRHKYAKTVTKLEKHELRLKQQQRVASVAQPDQHIPKEFFSATNGRLSAAVLGDFFSAVGRLIAAVHVFRPSESPDSLLNSLHEVVLAARSVHDEGKSNVKRAANQLITVVRNYTVTGTLFPRILVDAACSDLSMAVIERAKDVKVVPETDSAWSETKSAPVKPVFSSDSAAASNMSTAPATSTPPVNASSSVGAPSSAPSNVSAPSSVNDTSNVNAPSSVDSTSSVKAPSNVIAPSNISVPSNVNAPSNVAAPSNVSAPSNVTAPSSVKAPSNVSAPSNVTVPSSVNSTSSVKAPSNVSAPSNVTVPSSVNSTSSVKAPSNVSAPSNVDETSSAAVQSAAAPSPASAAAGPATEKTAKSTTHAPPPPPVTTESEASTSRDTDSPAATASPAVAAEAAASSAAAASASARASTSALSSSSSTSSTGSAHSVVPEQHVRGLDESVPSRLRAHTLSYRNYLGRGADVDSSSSSSPPPVGSTQPLLLSRESPKPLAPPTTPLDAIMHVPEQPAAPQAPAAPRGSSPGSAYSSSSAASSSAASPTAASPTAASSATPPISATSEPPARSPTSAPAPRFSPQIDRAMSARRPSGAVRSERLRYKPQHHDNEVAQLQRYIEDQTSGTVDAIGELLSGIKSNADAKELKRVIQHIQKLVGGIIAHFKNTLGKTHNQMLREKGTFLVDNLEHCLTRMDMLRTEELDTIAEDSRPNRHLKQRLAGVSYDMAKCTKELVKTVEYVALNMEVSDIDRMLD